MEPSALGHARSRSGAALKHVPQRSYVPGLPGRPCIMTPAATRWLHLSQKYPPWLVSNGFSGPLSAALVSVARAAFSAAKNSEGSATFVGECLASATLYPIETIIALASSLSSNPFAFAWAPPPSLASVVAMLLAFEESSPPTMSRPLAPAGTAATMVCIWCAHVHLRRLRQLQLSSSAPRSPSPNRTWLAASALQFVRRAYRLSTPFESPVTTCGQADCAVDSAHVISVFLAGQSAPPRTTSVGDRRPLQRVCAASEAGTFSVLALASTRGSGD